MVKVILTDAIINKMNIREINRHFRRIDESENFPICGKFNVTERAIRKVRKQGLNGGLEYYLALEAEIGRIVNDEKNW
jgi:hypothetical protein